MTPEAGAVRRAHLASAAMGVTALALPTVRPMLSAGGGVTA